jgi:N-acetylmuramate 1-kinase
MSQPERSQLITAFLAAHGWGRAQRRPLTGDASFRRYERLLLDGRPMVLMDAPPPQENVRPFMAIAQILADIGLAVPAIHAADEDAGLLLLEDFGDDTYTRLLARGEPERRLYELAVDLLIALHRSATAEALRHVPPLDVARAMRDVGLLLDWYWPAILGGPAPAKTRAEFEAAWSEALALWRGVPESLVLFDYHVDNLMLLRGRSGIDAIGLLDFQDAMRGPLPFDLVSLIDDARRDVPAALAHDLHRRYLAAFPELDTAAFEAAYAACGAERHTRILGTFTRLSRRDGKHGYLAFMPRVWRQLEARLAHPRMAPVAQWFQRHLPASDRRAPAVP